MEAPEPLNKDVGDVLLIASIHFLLQHNDVGV